VADNHWWTTEPPTETFQTNVDLAAGQLAEVEAAFGQASGEITVLEEALEAAGAPWTPGRRIGG
jgi:hypothetical protein